MSTYIISDVHGCYDQYQELLRKLNFSVEDELFLLGDALDRGPEPIKVLLDIMGRENATLIMGNHDATALMVLRQLAKEITNASISAITPELLNVCSAWFQDGGFTTMKQFQELERSIQTDILSFLEDAPFYETIEHNKKLYVLVHGGLGNFDLSKELDEYEPEELLWERPNYDREYFPSGRIVLVTGHTPTPYIREDKLPLIYEGHGHIAIDCGCAFGGKLAAYCIETGEVTYVDGLKNGNSEFM